MAQKNATPTRAQADVLRKNGKEKYNTHILTRVRRNCKCYMTIFKPPCR